MNIRLLVVVAALGWSCSFSEAAVRIKDIASVRGERGQQVFGYGLVIGLQGTGDTLRNAPYTEQALQAMLARLGVDVGGTALRSRNVAAVMATGEVSPGAPLGSRMDVAVSALGDAPSLMGGTLLLTQLSSPDGEVFATAQGAVSVTGFAAAGQGQTLSQGVPTAGHIANGAIIRRPSAPPNEGARMTLDLRNPDVGTAVRILDAINAYSLRRFKSRVASDASSRSVELTRPLTVSAARFVAEIGNLFVEPDTAARVVIDARTGTVVIGQDVQISTVAVTHGALTVRVTETPMVSQPEPRSSGKTVVTPNTQIDAAQGGGSVAIVRGSSLRSLVNGLNAIGTKPSGIIAILQAIKSAGALQAELVVQ